MKKNINIVLLGLFILIASGCEKFLEVEDYLILPAAQVSIANVMAADYGIIGSFWSQHWAQNNTSSQYKTYETYTLSSNANVIDRSYRELYYGGLADNEIILRRAKEEENWGTYLIAATLKAYTFQYLVDLYDNVPYTEAFNGDDYQFNPAIDNGEDVYDAIYTLLDEALSKDLSGFVVSRYEDFDLFFGADIDEWINFANTVKLRILLRQYYADPTYVEGELVTLLSEGTFLDRDVQLTNFDESDSKSNPVFETDQLQLNTKNNIKANATFTSFLRANDDTRMQILFDSINDDLIGMITGSYEEPSTHFIAPDEVASPIFTQTMPVNITTRAETELLLAEAYLRIGDDANAKMHYDVGVTSSFARMGAKLGDLITTGKYTFKSDTTDEAKLESIIMQKWIDAAEGARGIESFIEHVRTGYPKESEVSSSIDPGIESELPAEYVPGTLVYSKKGASGGRFPVRFPYPDSELNYNSNAAAYKSLADLDVMLTKVWWNK